MSLTHSRSFALFSALSLVCGCAGSLSERKNRGALDDAELKSVDADLIVAHDSSDILQTCRKPPDLPDYIYLKSPTLTMTHTNYYALKNGQIWYKPNPETFGDIEEGKWRLFEGTGLVVNYRERKFERPVNIVAIDADSHTLMALSNTGKVYMIGQVWGHRYQEGWVDKHGSPGPKDLTLPPHKKWTLSQAFRHDVKYHADHASGRKYAVGNVVTIYVLHPSGQRIDYWDSGLVPCFGRAYTCPDRGRFVATGLSSSASTLFVINKNGHMYTRLIDYENNGSNPVYRFTYNHDAQPARKGSGEAEILEEQTRIPRFLPPEDWRKQPAIAIEGEGFITADITILQTGEGDQARELRVAGRHADGSYGFYHKDIYDSSWQFFETGDTVKWDGTRSFPAEGYSGPELDGDYEGFIWKGAARRKKLNVELLGFYCYSSPATLRVHYTDTEHFDMTLHTVEAWGFSPTRNPGEGNEPKILLGTLEIPKDIRQSANTHIRTCLAGLFKNAHLSDFKYVLLSNDHYVTAYSRGRGVSVKMDLRRKPGYKRAGYTAKRFSDIATDTSLMIRDRIGELDPSHIVALNRLIDGNRTTLSDVNHTYRATSWAIRKNMWTHGFFNVCYAVFARAVRALQLTRTSGWIFNLATSPNGRPIFLATRNGLRLHARKNGEDHKSATRMLEERIQIYESERNRLTHSGLVANYLNKLQDVFVIAATKPQGVLGRFKVDGLKQEVESVQMQLENLEGDILVTGKYKEVDSPIVFRVKFDRLYKDILEADIKDITNHFKHKVTISPVRSDSWDADTYERVFGRHRKGPLAGTVYFTPNRLLVLRSKTINVQLKIPEHPKQPRERRERPRMKPQDQGHEGWVHTDGPYPTNGSIGAKSETNRSCEL